MLHEKNEDVVRYFDDVYASADMSESLPKFQMPRDSQFSRHAFRAVADEMMLDGNARQNLATFCQTWEEPEVHDLMNLAISKNIVDKDEYPQTAEIESRCVHMIADLWNAPHAETTLGTSTSGSSEAAMLGGLALFRNWRKRRRSEGKPADKPNMVTGPVQVCWHKFAEYWEIEHREIPMEGDRLIMNAEEVLKRVDENTIAVIPTLGVTFTGAYEPVKEVNDALDKLENDTGLHVPIHVDGASGGFIAPFVEPDLEWDFRLPRVKSINASGHKFGLAPLGVGWIMWRTKEDLPEELIFMVNYLGGSMPTFALNFSRPGGQVIAQYYLFLRLGREGYRRIHEACYDTAQYLADEIADLGPFELIYDGKGGIPAVTWKLARGPEHQFNLFDVADRLRQGGWLVPAYTLPPNREDLAIQRIIVRHGVGRDKASLLMEDYRNAMAHFDKHPVSKSMTPEEMSAFAH